MRSWTILVGLWIVASSAATSEASGRKQLWDVDLSKLIGQAGSPETEYVWGLAFSPDDTRLAIGFNRQGEASASHVIVVAVDHPKTALRRIDPDHARGLELFVHENIQWSPSGKLLAVYRRVLSLEGERTCTVPTDFEFGGFLADDRIVLARRGLPLKSGPEGATEIQVRRPDCSLEDAWYTAQGLFNVRGTCPQAGLIAVQGTPDWPHAGMIETHLVSYPGHLTTRQWTWDVSAVMGGMMFADSCRAICSGESQGKGDKAFHAACWSTSTGVKILDDARLTRTDGEAFAGSGGALLAVTVSRWACLEGKFWQYLDVDGCASRPTQRVLWNIETGQEVLSWPVSNQQFSVRQRKLSGPFALALSATGKFLAEGGAGRAQLYAVP